MLQLNAKHLCVYEMAIFALSARPSIGRLPVRSKEQNSECPPRDSPPISAHQATPQPHPNKPRKYVPRKNRAPDPSRLGLARTNSPRRFLICRRSIFTMPAARSARGRHPKGTLREKSPSHNATGLKRYHLAANTSLLSASYRKSPCEWTLPHLKARPSPDDRAPVSRPVVRFTYLDVWARA